MTNLDLMIADAKAAQARQKKLWDTGATYDAGETVSLGQTNRLHRFAPTTHAIAWDKLDMAYNPGLSTVG